MNKSVLVKFDNSSLNYTTSVNPKCDDNTLTSGFVNRWFNMGVYPVENMQKCIAIEIFTEDQPEKKSFIESLDKDGFKRLYLDYCNRFITAAGFADFYQIEVEQAYTIIEYGRQLNEADTRG